MVVCVDDFKMVGPEQNLKKGWYLIRQEIRLDEPVGLERYLGCDHLVGTVPAGEVKDCFERFRTGKGPGDVGARGGGEKKQEKLGTVTYIMDGFVQQWADIWSYPVASLKT